MTLTYTKRTTAPTPEEIAALFNQAGYTASRIYQTKQYEERLDYVSVWSKETDRSEFPLMTLVYDELYFCMTITKTTK